jgi:hypothetical protein
MTRVRNHGRIVGAEFRPRIRGASPHFRSDFGEGGTQASIGADPTRDHHH